METSFILSCESTIDLPYSYCEARGIPVLFYSYQVDGVSYEDDMGRDPAALPRFYGFLDEGKLPTTAQLNEFQYESFFDALLQQGDVLHIAFGSGMTASVQNAMLAAESLREKYPERKLVVIDSLCSSSGYGLLVDGAADLRDAGKSMDEIADWTMAMRQNVHHQFYSTELKFYRRSGRMSGAAAAIGTVLGICPIMRLDDKGRIIAYDKVRGKKNAVARTVETMKRHAQGGVDYAGKAFICHSNCLSDALTTKAAVEAAFPHLDGEVRICDIGTIVAPTPAPGPSPSSSSATPAPRKATPSEPIKAFPPAGKAFFRKSCCQTGGFVLKCI